MSYNYQDLRPFTLTDAGQVAVADVVDIARAAFKVAGAIRAGKFLAIASKVGDTWNAMACVDRAAELGYITPFPGNDSIAWQSGVYVPGRRLQE